MYLHPVEKLSLTTNKWYFNEKKDVTKEILGNAHHIIYRRTPPTLQYMIYPTYPLSRWNEIFRSYTFRYNLCGWRTLAVHRETFRRTIILLYCRYSRVRVFRITKLQKYKTGWAKCYITPPPPSAACYIRVWYDTYVDTVNKQICILYTLRR